MFQHVVDAGACKPGENGIRDQGCERFVVFLSRELFSEIGPGNQDPQRERNTEGWDLKGTDAEQYGIQDSGSSEFAW